MAQQQSVARGKSRSKRQAPQQAEPGTGANSHEDEAAKYEKELAAYLQERIKPGLNRGAIPLLARSIAKELAKWERSDGESGDAEAKGEPGAEASGESSAEAEGHPSAEALDELTPRSDAPSDLEDAMQELQAELGEDWMLSSSVQGDDAWLIAEKADLSQRLEAPTASVLAEAVELLNEAGGRSPK